MMYFFSVDFKKLFDKQAFLKQIKEQGKALVKTAASELAKEFLSTLGLPEVLYQKGAFSLEKRFSEKYPLSFFLRRINILLSKFAGFSARDGALSQTREYDLGAGDRDLGIEEPLLQWDKRRT